MNNMKSLSIILLLSLGVAGYSYAKSDCGSDCSTKCDSDCSSTCSTDCGTDCSDSCADSCSDSCSDNCSGGTSTFLRPRQSTTDLTYLNNLSFYNRYHDARCSFFTWDSTLFFQKNRSEKCLGNGFFGHNPLIVAEQAPSHFNSINLGLGNTATGESFSSTVSLCPRREVVGWLNHLWFNLDCFCTGLWFDVSFAVARAKHTLNFREANSVVGNISTIGTTDTATPPANVAQSFANLNVFSNDCSHTGVDDVMLRIGYDYSYCDNDHMGIYFLGIVPTGKAFDNTRWFQPLVGSKHGAVGAGFEGDYTIWSCDNSDLVFQTELLYQYRLRHEERRIFDYSNGSLSRFLLVASEDNVDNPVSGYNALESCVRVEPRSQLEWWANFHYQWCNWSAEFSYNLWFRDCEKISCANFDFGNTGIFDMTRCTTQTSNSCAKIDTLPLAGTPDQTFVNIQSGANGACSYVNNCSAIAKRVLTNKISGAIGYNNVWCDCYPWYLGFGAGYEFASSKYKRHALENVSIYGKMGISW